MPPPPPNPGQGAPPASREPAAKPVTPQETGDFLPAEAALPPEIEYELARLKPEEEGDRIGPYKLLQQIGEGGFGVVWMAEQEKPVRRRVALKIIKMGMDTKEVVARFEQERQALAVMDHPNIAKVFDAGATQFGRPFFVMELVRGTRITDYCDQANLPTRQRLELFIQTCNAVQHAHQKGIIHRDLKPSNVLVSLHDGVPVPKIIDFGVAKATQSQRFTDRTLFTQFEQMIGTPLYMSPEQAEMSGLDIDTRSDIYSLGVLLYELLTGHTPFAREELMQKGHDEIRRVIREQEPQRPSTFLRAMTAETRASIAQHRQIDAARLTHIVRGDLDWIVMKALEKDRTRRYETATGLARDIQRHLANEPVHARPASAAYRLRRLVKRNKLAFTAAAIVAISVLAGLGFSTWSFLRAQAALRDLAGTAPEFVARARELFREERFDEALQKADFAIALDPQRTEFQLAKADLLEALLKFGEAKTMYETVLASDPKNERALRHQRICDELLRERRVDGTFPAESLSRLIAVMTAEKRNAAEQLPAARLLGPESEAFRQFWLERLRVLPLSGKPLEERLRFLPNGRFELDLNRAPVSDLSPLAGMPLDALDLSFTRVSNLRALAGGALRNLDLSNSAVDDLAPLTGLPIEELKIAQTRVTNLGPLRGMPLRSLDADGCSIADLDPLADVPLKSLRLSNARCRTLAPLARTRLEDLALTNLPIGDLRPLHGMPLESLELCSLPVSDLSPLAGLPLKRLMLRLLAPHVNLRPIASCAQLEELTAPADGEGFAALRQLPALARISDSREAGWPEMTAAEFWRRWEPLQAAVERIRPHVRGCEVVGIWETKETSRQFTPSTDLGNQGDAPWPNTAVVLMNRDETFDLYLHRAGMENLECLAGLPIRRLNLQQNPSLREVTPLAGMSLSELNLESTQVSDLSVLRGMPLQSLRIGATPIRDLAPLQGLPLRHLSLWATKVSDLTPLAGMPLEILILADGKVRDLSPLRGMPLRQLYLNGCEPGIDVGMLADLPTLRALLLPPQPVNVNALRKLTKLTHLSYEFNWNTKLPLHDAASFWAAFEAEKNP